MPGLLILTVALLFLLPPGERRETPPSSAGALSLRAGDACPVPVGDTLRRSAPALDLAFRLRALLPRASSALDAFLLQPRAASARLPWPFERRENGTAPPVRRV